jgi:hypothetical protein
MSNYAPGPAEDGVLREFSPATTYAAGSSEPAPAPTGAVVVELDGKRLTLEQGRFRVEDITTGALLAEGTENDLFRGPGPRFVDSATGQVILAITWDEYDAAQQAAYDGYEWPQPTPVMYFSTDGSSWEQVFSGNEGNWLNTVAAGPGGFLVTGSTDDGRTIMWRSGDGRSWEEAAATFDGTAPQWLGGVYPTANGYLAQADDGVWSSTDGMTWTKVFTAGLYGDKMFSVGSLAAGSLGTVLTGSMYPYVEPQPMVVTKDGKTLTVDPLKGSVVVTDASGVIFDRTFDASSQQPPAWVEETGDGFKLLADDGTVVFEATTSDLETTVTASSDVGTQPENLLVFSADGITWNEVGGLDLTNDWVQALGVTPNGVLVLVQDNVDTGDGVVAYGEGTAGAATGSATEPADLVAPSVRLYLGTPAG